MKTVLLLPDFSTRNLPVFTIPLESVLSIENVPPRTVVVPVLLIAFACNPLMLKVLVIAVVTPSLLIAFAF